MKRITKKLDLAPQTIRVLTNDDLLRTAGGIEGPTAWRCTAGNIKTTTCPADGE